MKKIFPILFAAILCLSLLAGCGASSNDTSAATNSSISQNGYDIKYDADSYETADEPGYYQEGTGALSSALNYQSANPDEKVIYTASSEIETTEFDQTIDGIQKSINSCGAYLERSYISGNSYSASYYGYAPYRSAELTVRVPCDKFEEFIGTLSQSGHVLYTDVSTDTVTAQYYDTQSRLEACKAEHARLIEMMEKAETVADMITIEQRLSEVEYEIDSYTSTKNQLDNQIEYSTIYLYVNEVENLTEKEQTHQTYWQQIASGFKNTLKSVGTFFKELFRLFITAIPVLVILAVIAAVVIIIVRRISRRKKRAKLPSSDGTDSKDNN